MKLSDYVVTGSRLRKLLNLTPKQAKKILKDYYKQFPKLKELK